MIPIKLAFIFAKIAKDHGQKILHSNNIDLLTQDLSNALQKQKDILSDSKKSTLATAYDVLPAIIEVKILSLTVARKLGIDTKGRPVTDVLQDIAQAADARGSAKSAQGIKDTLDWTRALFANPEIQDVLKMEMPEIEKPSGPKDLTKFFVQLTSRSQGEFVRVQEFLKRAKNQPPKPGPAV